MTDHQHTNIVAGIVGPIGCNRQLVINTIEQISKKYSYEVKIIKISDYFNNINPKPKYKNEYSRIIEKMDIGDHLCESTDDKSILAKHASIEILKYTESNPSKKIIYVIDSLKRPSEVIELRRIFGDIFSLFAIHSSEEQRNIFLQNSCDIENEDERNKLINRDQNDVSNKYGQRISKTFHLADFFLEESGDNNKVWNVLLRYFDLLFGAPFITPTFSEYSMYMAHAAAIRSADLSRQVGAVITRNEDIISSGSNECPKAFGGTYWPIYNKETFEITDIEDGRDYKRGIENNSVQKNEIIGKLKEGISGKSLDTLNSNIENSGINDLTEFVRAIHAEMDAILSCSKRGISTNKSIMYCTLYPCHNCAKHIVASGISKVIYIEPYPKSKTIEMHDDSITHDKNESKNKVLLKAFIGVGPRQYINLFSMHLSTGKERLRKEIDDEEKKISWKRDMATPRIEKQYLSYSHIIKYFQEDITKKLKNKLKTYKLKAL